MASLYGAGYGAGRAFEGATGGALRGSLVNIQREEAQKTRDFRSTEAEKARQFTGEQLEKTIFSKEQAAEIKRNSEAFQNAFNNAGKVSDPDAQQKIYSATLDSFGIPEEKRVKVESFGADGKPGKYITPDGMEVKGPKKILSDMAWAIKQNPEKYKEILGEAQKAGVRITKAAQTAKDAAPPTPTDIDDFVDRANEESIRTTGEPLTPGKKNEMALQFKRAQAPESARVATATAGGKLGIKMKGQEYDTALSAKDNIAKIDNLIKHLEESEAITGLGADIFNQIERVKALLGSDVAAGKASDTEILDAMMGSEVFPLIKSLGIGARGLDTPAEREFMRKVLTGEISLNKNTLLQMANVRKDIANRAITRWNERVDRGEADDFFEFTGFSKRKIDIPGAPSKLVDIVPPEQGLQPGGGERPPLSSFDRR
ncbi:MAG: hypothetical protein KAV87_52745 [Desulfobacteraceae bacterium]|nr:hypothetical protein [Desulfobacteraceae bacterium]